MFSKVTMSRDSGVVEDVQVSEMHVVRVTAKKEVGATIHGSQTFKLSGNIFFTNFRKFSSLKYQKYDQFQIQAQVPILLRGRVSTLL